MITAVLLATVWAPVVQQSVVAPKTEHIVPVLTMTGDMSRVPGPRFVVCGDQKELDAVWSRHTGQPAKVYYSESPAPVVDFSHYMVVFVFEGSSGNSQGVGITSVVEASDAIRVGFRDYGFQTIGPDGGGSQVAPWGLAVLPRSAKKLIFERDVRGKAGKDPVWAKEGAVSLKGKRDSYSRL